MSPPHIYSISLVTTHNDVFPTVHQQIATTKNVPMQILNTNSSGKSYTANEDSTIGLVSDHGQ